VFVFLNKNYQLQETYLKRNLEFGT
jgi:hypothetical protein